MESKYEYNRRWRLTDDWWSFRAHFLRKKLEWVRVLLTTNATGDEDKKVLTREGNNFVLGGLWWFMWTCKSQPFALWWSVLSFDCFAWVGCLFIYAIFSWEWYSSVALCYIFINTYIYYNQIFICRVII